MIKANFKTVNDELVHITIKGHAYSGEHGHDLVCAGVSAVTIGALNSLKDVDTAFQIKILEGYVEVIPLYRPTYENQIVLEVLKNSLLTIAETYGKYLKISEERNKLT